MEKSKEEYPEDKKDLFQDLEAILNYGIEKVRENVIEVMRKGGIPLRELPDEKWAALENSQVAFQDLEDFKKSYKDYDEPIEYEKERQQYLESIEEGKKIAVELVSNSPIYREYETVCSNLDIDPDDFCLAIIHTFMNSMG